MRVRCGACSSTNDDDHKKLYPTSLDSLSSLDTHGAGSGDGDGDGDGDSDGIGAAELAWTWPEAVEYRSDFLFFAVLRWLID